MTLTRRRFLTRVAAAGGASLMYEAMTGLGLLAAPSQSALRPDRPRLECPRADPWRWLARPDDRIRARQGRLRLSRPRGRARPGGRVFTVRRGTVSEEEGPARQRRSTMACTSMPDRCESRTITRRRWCTAANCRCPVGSLRGETPRGPTWIKPDRRRWLDAGFVCARPRADFDGYIVESLSKALSQAQPDQPLTADDRDRLLAYLRHRAPITVHAPWPTMPQRLRGAFCAAVVARLARRASTSNWGSTGTLSRRRCRTPEEWIACLQHSATIRYAGTSTGQ